MPPYFGSEWYEGALAPVRIKSVNRGTRDWKVRVDLEIWLSEQHCGLCPFAGCERCENSEREIIAKLDKGACGKRGTKQKKDMGNE